MSISWFYADNQRQQQGPVADSWLYNAYQRGEITLNTLVWREGMPQWLPLSRVAGELGIAMASAPPPPPSSAAPPQYAPRPPVAAKKSGGSGCLIIGIILLVGFVVVGGILAAIAIPAYQDYVSRAKVMNARMQGTLLKADVATFYTAQGRCPVNGDEGFNPPTSYASVEISSINIGALDDGRCAIQILFNDLGNKGTQGAELVMAMDGDLEWTETSTLPERYTRSSTQRP
jgi:type IV pilus assembly protein PilA